MNTPPTHNYNLRPRPQSDEQPPKRRCICCENQAPKDTQQRTLEAQQENQDLPFTSLPQTLVDRICTHHLSRKDLANFLFSCKFALSHILTHNLRLQPQLSIPTLTSLCEDEKYDAAWNLYEKHIHPKGIRFIEEEDAFGNTTTYELQSTALDILRTVLLKPLLLPMVELICDKENPITENHHPECGPYIKDLLKADPTTITNLTTTEFIEGHLPDILTSYFLERPVGMHFFSPVIQEHGKTKIAFTVFTFMDKLSGLDENLIIPCIEFLHQTLFDEEQIDYTYNSFCELINSFPLYLAQVVKALNDRLDAIIPEEEGRFTLDKLFKSRFKLAQVCCDFFTQSQDFFNLEAIGILKDITQDLLADPGIAKNIIDFYHFKIQEAEEHNLFDENEIRTDHISESFSALSEFINYDNLPLEQQEQYCFIIPNLAKTLPVDNTPEENEDLMDLD